MRKPIRVAIVLAAVAVVAIMLAVPFNTMTASAGSATRAPVVYNVGGQDQMKTRNWLPAIANDVWTADVLGRGVLPCEPAPERSVHRMLALVHRTEFVGGRPDGARTELVALRPAILPAGRLRPVLPVDARGPYPVPAA